VNTALLVTVLAPTVTDTGPVVAPAGTVTVKLVVVAADTTALVPLKLTPLFAAIGLNAVPLTTTVWPTNPLEGENDTTERPATAGRVMVFTFPAAS